MHSEIKITVIVPAYNVERWLPRCLESICKQSYRNLEIIVIDDGSTDNTGTVLDEYAGLDNRIKAIHQENAGLIGVRNRGIEEASGQYISFVDGDDEIEPDMLERLLNNAIKYDAEISQCGILYCFYDGRRKPMHGTGKLYLFDRTEGYRTLLRGEIMEPSLCNKLYRGDVLQNSCPDETIVNNEDLLRNSVLFGRAKRTVLEDFCGYHYWRRAESMSNNAMPVKVWSNILRARNLIEKLASDDVRDAATASYISAVISTYNSLIGHNKQEEVLFRKKCKTILHKRRENFDCLKRGMRMRAYAILYCSFFYDIFYNVHIKLLYAKIRKQTQ